MSEPIDIMSALDPVLEGRGFGNGSDYAEAIIGKFARLEPTETNFSEKISLFTSHIHAIEVIPDAEVSEFHSPGIQLRGSYKMLNITESQLNDPNLNLLDTGLDLVMDAMELDLRNPASYAAAYDDPMTALRSDLAAYGEIATHLGIAPNTEGVYLAAQDFVQTIEQYAKIDIEREGPTDANPLEVENYFLEQINDPFYGIPFEDIKAEVNEYNAEQQLPPADSIIVPPSNPGLGR